MAKRPAHRPEATTERGSHKPAAGPRWLLHAVVFVCGAVLMGLEIVGSRMLAPYFGNSIFVWGSLISVVLAALSLGYWLGGLIADRWPRPAVLAGLIALPGILIALLPFVYPALNRAIAGSEMGARLGPLVSSVLLFLIPSVFLGMISPFAVRLQARAVASVGSTAGGLYAISTAGSILGTLATAFYLIAVLGVANIVHALGLTLLAVAAAIFAAGRQTGRATTAVLLGVALLAGFVWSEKSRAAEPGLLLEEDSFYNHIRLAESGGLRYMDFENLRQSAMVIDDPYELRLRYTRFLALPLTLRPEPKRVLILGLGGGSFPKRLHRDFPDVAIDVVDIDPAVVAIAKRYFQVPEDGRLRLHIRDGRRFIRETREQYDLIYLDAYNSDTIPFHLTTREFLQEAAAHLAPGGVLVSNIIGSLRGPESAFFRAMYLTNDATSPKIYTVPVYRIEAGIVPLGEINIIVMATRDTERLSRGALIARAGRVGGKLVPATDLTEYAAHVMELPVETSDVPVLTDDFAPVEILRAAVRG
jgi:spermidine synthase